MVSNERYLSYSKSVDYCKEIIWERGWKVEGSSSEAGFGAIQAKLENLDVFWDLQEVWNWIV